MRRLSQGMVNLSKVKASERMMPKFSLLFQAKLWLESISFMGSMVSLTDKWQGGLATCLLKNLDPIGEPCLMEFKSRPMQ